MTSLLVISMFILLLAASACFVYAIFKDAKDFKEDIVFKPNQQEEGEHVHDSID